MVHNRVLRALVSRAAVCSRPFNSHDSFLLLRSLHALRYRSGEVKTICEKCAFAIASAHISVPVERVIDALNSLTSLQAARAPVVHERLAARLLEVSTKTTTPQAVQKAAVVVVKLGKRYCREDVAQHVFDVLTELLPSHPQDTALRLAVIGVFPYTIAGNSMDTLSACSAVGRGSRVDVVLRAALHLVDTGALHTLRGNRALQALHMYPVMAWLWEEPKLYYSQVSNELPGALGREGVGTLEAPWIKVKHAFLEDLCMHTVVPGGYTQFLHDFLPSYVGKESERNANQIVLKLLSVTFHTDFKRALNSYDVAKIAKVVSSEIQKHGKRLKELQREETNERGKQFQREETVQVLLQVVGSLVEQVQLFYKFSWSSRSQYGGTGNHVDQVVIGAVWGAVQKLVVTLPIQRNDVKETMDTLIQLTSDLAGDLWDVWSWVFYSMSMCARTTVFTEQLSEAAKKVVVMSSILRDGAHTRGGQTLPMRSATQALYATSLWAPDKASSKRAGKIPHSTGYSTHWGPSLLLADGLVRQLGQYRYKDYGADDLPMILQGLVNLMGAGMLESEEPSPVLKLVQNVLHYIIGLRDREWYNKNGVGVCCSVVALSEHLPDNLSLTDAVKHIMCNMSPSTVGDVEGVRRLLRCALSLRRNISLFGNGATVVPRNSFVTLSETVCDFVLLEATKTLRQACSGSRDESEGCSASLLLDIAELAQTLGATLTFDSSVNQVDATYAKGDVGHTQRVIELDVLSLFQRGKMTPVDSAHLLYLMSCGVNDAAGSFQAHGRCGTHALLLRQLAIGSTPPANMHVETLIYLLRANAKLAASKLLFDRKDLTYIMDAATHYLVHRRQEAASSERGGDAQRIVLALFFSQVPQRLRYAARSCVPLMESVNKIIDKMEVEQSQTPEKLFELRLLCGG